MRASSALPFPPFGEQLTQAFESMPPPVRKGIQSGFEVVGQIDPGQVGDLATPALESLRGHSTDARLAKLSEKLGLSLDELRWAIAGATMLALALTTSGEDPASVINSLSKSGMVSSAAKPGVERLSVALSQAPVAEALEHRRIASEVLPSLTFFEATVDARIGFKEEAIKSIIPIALFHINTDADGQQVWLQATKSQVAEIADDLQRILKKMDAVEEWASSKTATREG